MNDRIQEIRRRHEAATPGTWNSTGDAVRCDHSPNGWICQMFEGSENSEEPTRDFENAFINAEFIANAPDDIAYLLSEVERLQQITEAQGKVIESYQRIEKDMESDYVQVLELIKKNELCTHMSKTGTYKLADEALSHL
ncbi:hypothetical protein QYF50_18835 [Paenibacillus vini]|uniref:hypothetical protein n=1 Tax=Paenibacillus vini TaxID=1476024 RepID=UPI0025B6CE1E|nr:hypothetical protein [Paenibacillus vini]MDN4069962.1 hypothetical protein [Paenibacillus vini]